MPTWLNVAEKPSVAKELSSVLSNGSCRTGQSLSRFNPLFEFELDGNQMLCTSVAGHLMNDELPPETRSWQHYPLVNLFTASITKHVKPEMEPVKRNLEALGRRAAVLVLWMDCDREGENICFEVMQVVQAVNRGIRVCRAHFSALTKRDLFLAVRNLKVPNRALSDAVEARQEIDLRIGAVFSRFQTIKFRDSFSGMPRVLSFGPCQIPTLGFVVHRHWERQGFVAEDYFTLLLRHGQTIFHSCRGSLFDQVAATLVLETMLETAGANAEAQVVDVVRRPTRRRPPAPLATVAMQKLAATHLHISSEQCMTWAESLYQEGLISYPRTETDSFSFTDEELREIAALQHGNPAVADYVTAMLDDPAQRFRRPLKGGHDDKAHPPIYPTKLMRAEGDNRTPLYNLIVRHFLACVSPDAVAATTTVTAVFGGEKFTTAGTTILEKGWLDIYPYERWHSTCLPVYEQGEHFAPTDVTLEQHRTVPPPHLTETALIALMDEHGIGTDATIAQHIKTVLDRGYVKREGSFLVPTALGVALASAYAVIGLLSLLQPQLRAQMELAMSDIVSGKASKSQVVDAAVQLYSEVFRKVSLGSKEMYEELCCHLSPAAPQMSPAADACGTGRVVQRRVVPCGVCHNPMDLVEQTEGGREVWCVRCGTCCKDHRVPNGRLNQLTACGQSCILCGFGVLDVRSTEKQTAYTVCPHCFTSPPPGTDMESFTGFRCFQCLADCPLAKGLENMAITRCASCGEHDVRLCTGVRGAFLSCRGFPACRYFVTLPWARRVRPTPTMRCASCQAVMLQFEFGGMPTVPGLEEGECVCVFCDGRLQEYVSVKGRGPRRNDCASNRDHTDDQQTKQQQAPYTLPVPSGAVAARRRVPAKGKDTGTLCGCGAPARQLVSRKEVSKGRRFLTCASKTCLFFQWLD
ncbi:putative DNA topoisomerase III [Trypanosoma rangeli]|uniref:DNA topoisomerase n=1 Tax=Trypanosoma rangeli TaxID=5698 RepID=A0A3R7KDV1_TRYRA|nr:putative DNA topoisomerase III [Trypanosoma rangeli]RNF06039.1 putative DNA topoisomerase III [Trypanosoma rangeli]|eukprot:RNF06039.1 putative DNA topoisomerase III [Trypanosoma rangeli]